MINFDKIIKIKETSESRIESLSSELKISKLASRVLLNRGLSSVDECYNFLNPTIDKLLDPFLLKDMEKAVNRIATAIENDEKIWIYGDYDVDGVTSTSILMLFLNDIGVNSDYYIPDRMTEGYGLNKEAISHIHQRGGQVVITVDCGITSFEVVDFCNELGIDVIITDHHTCEESLPNAIAVINPNRRDSEYPFKKLAGVGVAFKLIQALASKLHKDIDFQQILPITAIGTVADIVSLTGENRIIVKNGLDLIKKSSNLGIQAILSITGLNEKEVTSGHIGFVIGPRINAAGRIGLARKGVELFLSEDLTIAVNIAKQLDEENVKRQEIEARILKETEALISRNINIKNEKVFVVSSENWHPGVIGIVCSRITERYYRPCILISVEDGEGRGSARSIPTFDIYDGLSRCKDLFEKFGGHKQAAGLTIEKGKIELFKERINNLADKVMTKEDLIPEITVDCEISPDDISIETAYQLKSLEPFGIENPSPVLIYRNVKIISFRQIGKDNKHLKLVIEKEDSQVECIGFNFGEYGNKLMFGDIINIVVSIEINNFMGNEKVQLNIKEIKKVLEPNVLLKTEYFTSLKDILYQNSTVYGHNRFEEISFAKIANRIDYVIKAFEDDKKTLVLINNLNNAEILLANLQYKGRNFIKNIDISFSKITEDKLNSLVINPRIDKIEFNNFDSIIIYDSFFDQDYFLSIINNFKNKEVEVLSLEEDINQNLNILEEIVPSLDVLRIAYRIFVSMSKEPFDILLEEYIALDVKDLRLYLNRVKFEIILDIFKESKLLNYKQYDNRYHIEMELRPKEKIDILENPKLKYLNELKNKLMNSNI